uniref:Putative 13.7 kDa midgut protein n=1 Tax=Nyssomyia neivai TaxID=330878 RepID=A0A1L8DAE9_9DIPT
MARILFLIALCIIGVSQVSATWCYSCNTTITPSCGDPFDSTAIDTEDCTSLGVCGKMKVTVDFMGIKESVTSRGCLPIGSSCSTGNIGFGITIDACEVCDTDYCNNSQRLTGGIAAILSLIISFMFIRMTF